MALTQRELARRARCSDMAVSLLERNRLNPLTRTAMAIWDALLELEAEAQ